jgi:prevent-host-death family protein
MKTAGIVDLKAHLSEYLAVVRAGEEVVVTDRGVSIARLAPLAPAEAHRASLEALEKAGLVRRPTRPFTPELLQRELPEDPEGSVRAALAADREGFEVFPR